MKYPSGESAILSVLGMIMAPIVLLNWLGGIVGGVWLLLDGNAHLAILGLLFLFLETMVLSIFLMPGLGLVALGVKLYEKHHRYSGHLLMGLNCVYNVFFILIATYFIFEVVLNNWSIGSIVPVLLLAYTLAAGPWTYMAAHEPDNGGYNASVTAVFFIDIGVIGTMLMLYHGYSLIYSFWPMRISMVVLLIVQLVAIAILSKKDSFEDKAKQRKSKKKLDYIEGDLVDDELQSWDTIK